MSKYKWTTISITTVMQFMKQNRIKTHVKSVVVGVAIITEYMQMVMAAVMDGQAVSLPNKFGTLYIKKISNEGKLKTYVVINKEGEVERLKGVNFNRIGYNYKFVIEGNDFLDDYGIKFYPSLKEYRKPLAQMLLNTDKDYRTNLLRD